MPRETQLSAAFGRVLFYGSVAVLSGLFAGGILGWAAFAITRGIALGLGQ